MSDPHPFERLSPELVIDAVESAGYWSDLRILQLNSYENRVYQIGIEGAEPIIAKFYRPERWSDAQILEEHAFSLELAEVEIPVVPPLVDAAGNTLHRHDEFRFSLFARRGGHPPELDNMDHLLQLGRLMARLHAVGSVRDYATRPTLNMQDFAVASHAYIAEHWIPAELAPAYNSLCADLIAVLTDIFAAHPPRYIRAHGDCHVGNILWRDTSFHFVDLDDSRMAPAIQDLWMFLSGERDQQLLQLSELIAGYEEFFDFDRRELRLVEALRTLRIMHHSAWIARRWQDPAFPRGFTWFNSPRYWSDHILELREQLAALQEPPLVVL